MLTTARLVFGYLWGAGLLAVGLIVWRRPLAVEAAVAGLADGARGSQRWAALLSDVISQAVLGLSVWAMAGGVFVFLVLVADVVCPRVPMGVSGFAKTFSGTVAWLALGWSLFQGVALIW